MSTETEEARQSMLSDKLFSAVISYDLPEVELLLEIKAQVNLTTLHFACRAGYFAMVRLFFQHGVNFTEKSDEGEDSLLVCARSFSQYLKEPRQWDADPHYEDTVAASKKKTADFKSILKLLLKTQHHCLYNSENGLDEIQAEKLISILKEIDDIMPLLNARIHLTQVSHWLLSKPNVPAIIELIVEAEKCSAVTVISEVEALCNGTHRLIKDEAILYRLLNLLMNEDSLTRLKTRYRILDYCAFMLRQRYLSSFSAQGSQQSELLSKKGRDCLSLSMLCLLINATPPSKKIYFDNLASLIDELNIGDKVKATTITALIKAHASEISVIKWELNEFYRKFSGKALRDDKRAPFDHLTGQSEDIIFSDLSSLGIEVEPIVISMDPSDQQRSEVLEEMQNGFILL